MRFLFLRVLRYFSSPGYLPANEGGISCDKAGWIVPFGHLWIKASCQLPRDFRGLETSFFGSYYLGIHYLL